MTKPLSDREKRVLYEIVKHPEFTDNNLAERTRIKLSTVTAIRRRLKKNGIYRMVRIPCLQFLGAELLAVNYSVYNATAPMEKRLETGRKFASDHKEVFWAINEYVQSVAFHFSRNYTDILSNIIELERHHSEQGYLDEGGIDLMTFSFKLTQIHSLFDFTPLLANSFGFPEDDERNEDMENGNGERMRNEPDHHDGQYMTGVPNLTQLGKQVYYNLVKHPEMTDTELSEIISVSQRTITKFRKQFKEEGLIRTVAVPNLEKLGFKMMVFDHAKLNLKVKGDQRNIILQAIMGIKPPITFIVGSSDVVALTVYEDFATYRRSINRFAEVYKYEKIFVKEPKRLLFSLSEMDMIKDHVYSPIVAKILGIEETPSVMSTL